MKLLIVLALATSALAVVYDVYPTKYDDINIDEILNNKRLSDNYLQCLLKEGRCTEEGIILRDIIPDALITGCSKCNKLQKEKTEKVIRFLIEKRKPDWDKLLKLYDPEGKYQAAYAHYLKEK